MERDIAIMVEWTSSSGLLAVIRAIPTVSHSCKKWLTCILVLKIHHHLLFKNVNLIFFFYRGFILHICKYIFGTDVEVELLDQRICAFVVF